MRPARGAVVLAAFFCAVLAGARPAGAEISCEQAIQKIWQDDRDVMGFRQTLSPATTPECAWEYLKAVATSLKDPAEQMFRPARENVFRALQNYSAQQQQSSTTSSTASVSPVSKVTGPSAIAQEFSGVSVSSSTSALTFQFSPGTLLSKLSEAGVLLSCSTVLHIASNCVLNGWRPFAERLTFSASANTSSTGQSITGTAATTGSTGSAPASLSLAGTSEPSFGGFGVKGVVLYVHNKQKAGQVTTTQKTDDEKISRTSVIFANGLLDCPALDTAMDTASQSLAKQTTVEDLLAELHRQFGPLGTALYPCLQSRQQLVQDMQDYLAAILIDTAAYRDVAAAQKPLIGFEYDLNTPANQPSYSSLKGNVSWSFGGQVPSDAISCTGVRAQKQGETITSPACSAAGAAISGSASTKQVTSLADTRSQARKTAGSATPLLTINLSMAGDLYNGTPPASVPSSERLRDFQGGAEIDYKVSTSKIPRLGSLIGDSTLAGTYYYQDQTSPSVLKGPPSGITIANLPSAATQVYTTRGPINLGQIRFGFGAGSNVSFPIGFTYANRSELTTRPIRGLQFGLSYNLSSLFTSAKTPGAQ